MTNSNEGDNLFFHDTPMLASKINGIPIQLGNGPDRYSATFMRRRFSCPAARDGMRRRRLTLAKNIFNFSILVKDA